jgi:hypothetical protein
VGETRGGVWGLRLSSGHAFLSQLSQSPDVVAEYMGYALNLMGSADVGRALGWRVKSCFP